MHCNVKITEIKTIHEIEGYWTSQDYINLLGEFDFDDAKNSEPSELRELLEMAINDLEPNESAEIILNYKLKDKLNSGQIKNLSFEMAEDNESEEYPDISLHYPLFSINQLLYKSYNGKFQNAKATKMKLELNFTGSEKIAVTKEMILKALSPKLAKNNLIVRLFDEQLKGKKPFTDADKIIWELHDDGQRNYTIITSDYWLNDDDVNEYEFESSPVLFRHPEEGGK